MPKLPAPLPLAALALVLPTMAQAQDYNGLPPLAPTGDSEVLEPPIEYRTAPAVGQVTETTTVIDGVETITRTRQIELPAVPQAPRGPMGQHTYAVPGAYTPTPAAFDSDQWLDECRRRTAGRDKDDTGKIIGGLLGAIAGGFAGYEIAGAGDRALGTVLGISGGGLIGWLLGSLLGSDDENRDDCEAMLNAYLTPYGTPATRIASREISYVTYPAYAYAPTYAYASSQMVMLPVRSEVPQQVVVRENVREETYTVPGAARIIPAPSPKMIKSGR